MVWGKDNLPHDDVAAFAWPCSGKRPTFRCFKANVHPDIVPYVGLVARRDTGLAGIDGRGGAVALLRWLATKLRNTLLFELSMRRKLMLQQRNFDISDMF